MSERRPLTDFVEINPPIHGRPIHEEDQVSFIPMEDVTTTGQWVTRKVRTYREVCSGYTAFQEGDVLWPKITPCMENGKGCHATDLVNGIGFGSTEFHVLRAKTGNNPRFIYHWSRSRELRCVAERFMIGSAGQQRVQSSFFGKYEIPPILSAEQRRIAEILDAVDEAIGQTEALIAKLKKIKAGLLHDLLTRGLDENGELRNPEKHPEQFSRTDPFGIVRVDWEVSRLDSLADVDRGKFAHRPRNEPRFYGGKHPFLQTGDVAEADGEVLITYEQTLNDAGAAISREFPTGAIAITIAANIADTTILGRPMYLTDSLAAAVVKPPNNVRFVEMSIRRWKPRLVAQAPQSAQANINLEILRPLPIPTPNAAEQEDIASVFDEHLQLTRSEERYLDKLMKLKAGLMHDLLTGSKRVMPLEKAE